MSGRLIGDEFNKGFFLEYFQYPVDPDQSGNQWPAAR